MSPIRLRTRFGAFRLLGYVRVNVRAVLVVGLLALMAFAGESSVANGQEPTREYRFEGRANIDGAPAAKGTVVEIRVNDKAIATSSISDEQGSWVIQVNASLLEQGVCDAIFYVGGKRAERQWNRCTVSIVIEVSKPPITTPPNIPGEESPLVDPPEDEPPTDDPPKDDPPKDDPPGDDPPTDDPPKDDPPRDDPPTDDPPKDDPPEDDPPKGDPPTDDPTKDDPPDRDPPKDDPPMDEPVDDSITPPTGGSDDDDDTEISATQQPGAPPRTGSGGLIESSNHQGTLRLAIVAAAIALIGIAVAGLRRRRRS